MNQPRLAGFAILLGSAFVLNAAQPKPIQSALQDQELIPLKFPHAGMDVGALRWGDPVKPSRSTLPPNSTFSQSFLDALPRSPVAVQNFEKRRHFAVNVSATPGPQVLSAAKLAVGEASVDFSRCKFTCLDWGELIESSADLRTLSEAFVRGWYNLPGKALHNNALFQMELDTATNASRPWIVVRSLTANGLRYEMNKDSGIDFKLSASHAVASGSLGLQYKVLNKTTLQINQPMVLGYEVAYLARLDPPMPKLSTVTADSIASKYTFYWALRGSKQLYPIAVDTADLRARDERLLAETRYPQPVVQQLTEEIQQATPARFALIGEFGAGPGKSGDWRRLEEGSAFVSDELLRLRLVLDEPAYVYVLAKDSAGKAAVLYPKVEGEELSRGEDALLPQGEWVFPPAVTGDDGMRFDNDPSGTESFVVIASRSKPEGLPRSLAAFAGAAREDATRSRTATRAVNFGFNALLRLPAGYAKSASAPPPQTTPTPDPVPAANEATSANGASDAAATDPKPSLEVLFSGMNSATVLTLNLAREQIK